MSLAHTRRYRRVAAVSALLLALMAGCQQNSDDPPATTNASDAGDAGPYACDAVLVACCDETTGAYETKASCTRDGLQCPQGTTSSGCSLPAPETGPQRPDTRSDAPPSNLSDTRNDGSPSETPDASDAGPACDAIGIPCCDEQTGVFQTNAPCTWSGRECPQGTSAQACRQHETGVDGG